MRHRRILSLVILTTVLFHAQKAAAFKIGTHRAITMDALYRGAVKYNKANVSFTSEAVRAIDEEAAALDRASNTGLQLTEPWRHFDNETFVEGNEHVLRMKEGVISILAEKDGSLNKSNLKKAYQRLAYGLHAIQDFYSHSNWVELGNTDVCLTLGVSAFQVPIAAPGERTCVDDYKLTGAGLTKLTSGYWPGLLSCPVNPIKCHHGLKFNFLGFVSICDKEGIAKDSVEGSEHDKPTTAPGGGIPIPSPNPYKVAPMHGLARSLAEKATRRYVEQILADPRAQKNCKNVARFLGQVPTPD